MTSINNNKEFFELLAGTDSDSGSEVQKLVIPPRKKRFRRRLRNNPNTRHEGHQDNCECNAGTVSAVFFRILLVGWLITLTWLAVVLYKEILTLNDQVRQVVAAHQGVPDALHECHTLSRELQKNQSLIMERLTGFSILLSNFSVNISDMRGALSVVQQQLKASPSLLNDPRLIKDLPESVAKFGSKIQDLETTATALKEQDSRLDSILTSLTGNLTNLGVQVSGLAQTRDGVSANQLAAEKSAVMTVVDQIAANVASLNDTLSNKLQWTADDRVKDHKVLESLQEMNQNVTARLKTLEGLLIRESTPSIPPASSVAPTKEEPTPRTTTLFAPTREGSNSEDKSQPSPFIAQPSSGP